MAEKKTAKAPAKEMHVVLPTSVEIMSITDRSGDQRGHDAPAPGKATPKLTAQQYDMWGGQTKMPAKKLPPEGKNPG